MGSDLRLGTLCYGCGVCTSSCPIARTNPIFDPRQILRKIIVGKEDLYLENTIWLCSMCYNCQERCPQGVPVADLIFSLRNLSCRSGSVPQAINLQLDSIRASGKTYPLDEFDMKKREKAGLPRLKEKVTDVAMLLEENL